MNDQSGHAIRFRPLKHEDLPLMHRWLNEGEVLKWYGLKPTSLGEIEAEYREMIDGTELTRPFILTFDDRPIGYIQTYLIRDHPEYAAAIDVSANAAGIDLFIGEADMLNRGIGSTAIRLFLRDIVFSDESVDQCVLGPDPNNAVAIRAYGKVGFRYLKTVDIPGEPTPEYIMTIDRHTFLG